MFIVSSDAHRREDVGKVDNAFDIIRKFEIPTEYVVNVEFELDEKTEDHKEADYYYSIYKQKQAQKQEKIEAEEEKKKTEFTESLSDEMEKALKAIAEEKGIEYDAPKEKEEEEGEELSDFVKSINFVEGGDELIERAKAHIAKLEQMERESALQEAQEEEEETVDNPIGEALKDFHHAPVMVKEPAKEVQEEEVEEIQEPEVQEEVKSEPVKIVDTTRSNNLGSFNSIISEIKGTDKKPEPKPEEKVEEKPVEAPKKRKSFGGFMGAGGIVGTAESNKSSKTDK